MIEGRVDGFVAQFGTTSAGNRSASSAGVSRLDLPLKVLRHLAD